jgi:hypothetical protein
MVTKYFLSRTCGAQSRPDTPAPKDSIVISGELIFGMDILFSKITMPQFHIADKKHVVSPGVNKRYLIEKIINKITWSSYF